VGLGTSNSDGNRVVLRFYVFNALITQNLLTVRSGPFDRKCNINSFGNLAELHMLRLLCCQQKHDEELVTYTAVLI
jgi:hypothetical protein